MCVRPTMRGRFTSDAAAQNTAAAVVARIIPRASFFIVQLSGPDMTSFMLHSEAVQYFAAGCPGIKNRFSFAPAWDAQSWLRRSGSHLRILRPTKLRYSLL